MDLIPETEQIHFIKVGQFGFQRSILVNISDLEKIDFEQDTLYPSRWYSSMLWKRNEDEDMVYRSKVTGEVFTFSQKGIWNQDGLNHELLN